MQFRSRLIALALVPALVLVGFTPTRAADEPDELVPGTIVGIRTGTFVKFVARPPVGGIFDLPDTPANDPTTQGGVLHVFDTSFFELSVTGWDDTYDLPAGSGWEGLGSPAGSRGFKYRGAQTPTDPCAIVVVKPSSVKAVCRGSAVALDPPFAGEVAIVLTIGTGSKRYCASFGGINARRRAGALVRRAAPPPTACLTPPKLCVPVTQWGGLNLPEGVATDGSGNVYVAESAQYLDRIRKFDGSGTLLIAWGTTGNGDGQFDNPERVATDGSGNVYVADGYNYRIQKFDGDGTFLTKWGVFGSGNGQFGSYFAVATDGSGNVYVADTQNHRIQKFDESGTFLAKWGTMGSADGQFANPYGVATDASGNVYVADTQNHRIQKFDGSGTFLATWGTMGNGDGQFRFPQAVATDASGNVYVADEENRRIQKFDGSGTFLTKWGTSGAGPGNFESPMGLATDGSGNVYVADYYSGRIEKFSGCP